MRRLLIIGCGDIALRTLPILHPRYRIYALTHSRARIPELRVRGVVPIAGDLDEPASLGTLAGLAQDVLHCAPPPEGSQRDSRTAHLIAALARGKSLPQHMVYISTSGVYGDCGGGLVSETQPLRPATARAHRRADAERQLREWGRRSGARISILRTPGIYSGQRLPIDRLKCGTPALQPTEDAHTNHVHADDLARMVVAALWFGGAGRAYNASDDSQLKMGEYFDLVADRFGLPHPPRISRAESERRIPPALLSFMSESRRLTNQRIKRELRLKLRYPTVHDGITAAPIRDD